MLKISQQPPEQLMAGPSDLSDLLPKAYTSVLDILAVQQGTATLSQCKASSSSSAVGLALPVCPRLDNESMSAHARRLRQVFPELDAKAISGISGVTMSNLSRIVARLSFVGETAKKATPRDMGENNTAYARRLHATYPQLPKTEISKITGVAASTLSGILSPLSSAAEAAKAATPQGVNENNSAYARRLRKTYPQLAIKDISLMSGVAIYNLRVVLKEWCSSRQEIQGECLRQRKAESNLSYATRLHQAYPNFTKTKISAISGASISNLSSVFNTLSATATRVKRAMPKQAGENISDYARRLHAMYPDLANKDLCNISTLPLSRRAQVFKAQSLNTRAKTGCARQHSPDSDERTQEKNQLPSTAMAAFNVQPCAEDLEKLFNNPLETFELSGDTEGKPYRRKK